MNEESREIHDFEGPYQVHTLHTGDDVVFIKGHYGVYSYDSTGLRELVINKIVEHETELMKWNILKDRLS
jgi:hypothetical protein